MCSAYSSTACPSAIGSATASASTLPTPAAEQADGTTQNVDASTEQCRAAEPGNKTTQLEERPTLQQLREAAKASQTRMCSHFHMSNPNMFD